MSIHLVCNILLAFLVAVVLVILHFCDLKVFSFPPYVAQLFPYLWQPVGELIGVFLLVIFAFVIIIVLMVISQIIIALITLPRKSRRP